MATAHQLSLPEAVTTNATAPPGDFVPGTEAVGHLAAVFLGVEQVTTGPEVW